MTGLFEARVRWATAVAILLALVLAAAGCGEKSEPDAPGASSASGEPPTAGGAVLSYNDAVPVDAPGIELLEGSGASSVRYPIRWSVVEREPGTYDWRGADAIRDALAEQGVEPLWVAGGAPCWAVVAAARKGCDPSEPGLAPEPRHYRDYAEFIVALAERYPSAAGIEIWNEPNIPNFWRPTPDAGAYRELLETTVEVTESAGVDVPIIAGAPSPTTERDARSAPTKIPYTEFLDEVLGGGSPPAVDAVGLHPYSLLMPGADPVASSLEIFDQGAQVIERSAPGTPIWVTEVGLTTAGRNAVSPAEQASGLVELFEQLAKRGVPLISIHRLFDQVDAEFPFEEGIGVVAADRQTPKPAYCALADLLGGDAPVCES